MSPDRALPAGEARLTGSHAVLLGVDLPESGDPAEPVRRGHGRHLGGVLRLDEELNVTTGLDVSRWCDDPDERLLGRRNERDG